MTFPHHYTPPGKYPSLSDAELVDVLAVLTQDLVDLRSDFAQLAANYNVKFFRVFLDAQETSIAARNRLAEADTVQLTGEKLECEANIAATVDLCALVRTILELRREHGKENR